MQQGVVKGLMEQPVDRGDPVIGKAGPGNACRFHEKVGGRRADEPGQVLRADMRLVKSLDRQLPQAARQARRIGEGQDREQAGSRHASDVGKSVEIRGQCGTDRGLGSEAGRVGGLLVMQAVRTSG